MSNKISEELKSIERIVNEERDKHSLELFDKHEYELQLGEIMLLEEYLDDLKHPEWKPIIIDGKDTGYEISNIGIVKNPNGILFGDHRNSENNKYVYVSLTINGIKSKKLVHRLVAIAFIPNLDNKPEVNHINGKKILNWVGNLEWTTRQENADHAKINNLIKSGSNQPLAVYNETDAHNVCKLIEEGFRVNKIANTLNLPKSFIIGIMYRGEWKKISSQYNIPEHKHINVERDTLSCKIRKVLDSGIYDTNEILKILKLSDTKGHKKYINRVRNNYNSLKVKGSTTIDQLQ